MVGKTVNPPCCKRIVTLYPPHPVSVLSISAPPTHPPLRRSLPLREEGGQRARPGSKRRSGGVREGFREEAEGHRLSGSGNQELASLPTERHRDLQRLLQRGSGSTECDMLAPQMYSGTVHRLHTSRSTYRSSTDPYAAVMICCAGCVCSYYGGP